MGGIHPTAVVSSRAQVADSASVGPFTIINDDVVVGEGAEVGSHCELGVATSLAKQARLVIGPGSLVRSHSRIYQGSDFSGGLTTGHAVTIRENVVAGGRLQLGSQSILDGDCVLGDHVRIHTNVFVTKNSVVGSFVWLFSSVLLTDDPHPPSHMRLGVTIHDYAVLAAGCAVLPGVVLGRGCLVGCRALVTKDVPEGMVAVGAPAELRGPVTALPRRDGSGEPAYPWTTHYHRGYPEEVVREWVAAAGRQGA